MPVLQFNDIRLAVKVQDVYPGFHNNLVTAKNLGTDASISMGIYRTRLFVAAEAGFDKAIITHFQHSGAYREEFPAVKDGWYHPPTGG